VAAVCPLGSARLMDINVIVAEALQTAGLFAPEAGASQAGRGTASNPLQSDGNGSAAGCQWLMI